ncbi:MAG: sugar ABC transporter substrate-binding protein [Caldilineaceae bacterium]
MKTQQISRRTLLKQLGVGAAGLWLASCAPPAAAPSGGAAAPASQGKAVKLNALIPSTGPLGDEYMNNLIKEYKDKTGVEVAYSTLPFEKLMDKELTLVAAQSADVDVFGTHYAQIGRFGEALAPLNDLAAKDGVKGEDYVQGAFSAFTVNGNLLAIPYTFDLRALYYRTDLFDAAGIKAAPTTWQELVDTATKLNKPPDVYGYLIVGKGDPALREFSDLLWENGGDFLEKGLEPSKPAWNNDAGVEALQWWSDLVYKEKVAPPGVPSYGWEELSQLWTAGQAAMSKQWGPGASKDPKESKIVDKFSIAPLVGNKQKKTTAVCHGRAINIHSAQKEAAWEFVKYLTKKETMIGMYKATGARPAHTGALNEVSASAEGVDKLNLEASLAGAKNGYTWPLFPEFSDIQPILWGEIEKVLSGQKKPKEGLDYAASEAEKILKQAKLI